MVNISVVDMTSSLDGEDTLGEGVGEVVEERHSHVILVSHGDIGWSLQHISSKL